MNDLDLIEIVERSASLDDRLNPALFEPPVRTTEPVSSRRLETWRKNATGDHPDRFQMRLGWDGLDLVAASALARGESRLRTGATLPAWTILLREVAQVAAGGTATETIPQDGISVTLAASPRAIPFGEILLPFVVVASGRARAQAGPAHALLSANARMATEQDLLSRLTDLAGEVLMLEFSLFRDQQGSRIGHWLELTEEQYGHVLYDQFVARFRADPAVLFKEYAVLARLLSTSTIHWVEAQVEFLKRLSMDLPEISRVLGWPVVPGEVTGIQTGLSDSHRGGRQVRILAFGPLGQVVYKPKDLGLDQAFTRLLEWLNERGAPLPFRPLRMINRTSHGWVEFVPHRACQTAEEGHRYYRRAGMLVCLLYAFEGTDSHWENLIACGEHPVLVDLETVPHPFLPPGSSPAGADAHKVANTMMWNSVIRTGLLPWWTWGRESGASFDQGGLSGDGQEAPNRQPRWNRVNSDGMTLQFLQQPLAGKSNLPELNGLPLRLEDYETEIIDGFGEMHRFLREHRAALLAEGGPLGAFANQTARFLHRSTRLYRNILLRAQHPRFMREGIDRSIELDLLARALIPSGPVAAELNPPAPPLWPVVAMERAAMEQGDIPCLTVNSSAHDLPVPPGGAIRNCFPESAIERVVARVEGLNERDLERQTSLIRGSFFTRRATGVCVSAPEPAPVEARAFSPDRLLAEARTMGEELSAQAIRGQDGSVTWIAPQMNFEAGRFVLQRLGFGWYDGVAGLVLFLAALEHLTGKDDLGELARGAMEPLLRALRLPDERQAIARTMGIGVGSGLGGVVYTLARGGALLRNEAMITEACAMADLLAPELANPLSPHDFLMGMSGAILGLLALHEVSRDQTTLEQARHLGRALLAGQAFGPENARAGASRKHTMLTGFSHGAAGIACALARLYRAGGDEEFLAAAREAIAYEQSLFDRTTKNWPDLVASFRGPVEGPARFRVSWCHGAPGIGLGRLGALDVIDNPLVREDIEAALQTTLALGLADTDFVCCGNWGRVETLLTAAQVLRRPDLEATVHTQAMNLLDRARQGGAFALHPLLPREIYNPGFFTGASGIGYMLLRVASPTRLPSALRCE